jgi:hypothetical protein
LGIGTVVEARGGDGYGKFIQSKTFALQLVAYVNLLLARCILDHHGWDRLRESELPFFVHFLSTIAAHAKEVDVLVAGQGPHNHRELVAPSFGVRHILEEPRLALLFGKPAILPPDQRV